MHIFPVADEIAREGYGAADQNELEYAAIKNTNDSHLLPMMLRPCIPVGQNASI